MTEWPQKYEICWNSGNMGYFQKAGAGGVLEKFILKNFEKLIGKDLCWSPFFNTVADLRETTKETPTQVFSCKFCKIFKNIYCADHLRAAASNMSYFQWPPQDRRMLGAYFKILWNTYVTDKNVN